MGLWAGDLPDPLITSLPYLVVLRILPSLKTAFKQGSQNGALVGKPATCLCMEYVPESCVLRSAPYLCSGRSSRCVTLERKPPVWVL